MWARGCRSLMVALAVCSGTAVAQALCGRITDFAGKPAANVVVNLRDATGKYCADCETRGDGSYRFAERLAAGTVVAWLEGVELSQPIPATGDADFSFERAKFFTLRGHAVDPGGGSLVGAEIFCLDAEAGWLATARTGDKGAWSVRLNRAVAVLVLDPRGWRHEFPGPFTEDRGVAIDLRSAGFFRLEGTLRDENGLPVGGAHLTAGDGKENITNVVSAADGTWGLWSNRAVASLWITSGEFVRSTARGEWSKAAKIDLDWRGLGFVVLRGRVVDAEGRPIGKVPLRALDLRGTHKHLPAPIGRSGSAGTFQLLVPTATRVLLALTPDGDEGYADGPFDRDGDVVVRVEKAKK